MTARTIEDIFGLSPLQEGMLFHTLRSPGSGVYIEQLYCLLRGNLDVPRLEEAWRKVIERHARSDAASGTIECLTGVAVVCGRRFVGARFVASPSFYSAIHPHDHQNQPGAYSCCPP